MRYSRVVTLAAAMIALSAPGRAWALADYASLVQQVGPFIWASRYLTTGTHTVTTANLSGNPLADTVLHVLKFNTATNKWDEIAANDDCGTSVSSCVTFVAPADGSYFIWVHAYANANWGNADVVVDGATFLTQSPFAGNGTEQCWNDSQNPDYSTLRLVGKGNQIDQADTMLFLNKQVAWYLQHDDDSLNGRYSVVSPTTTDCGIAYFGLYPGEPARNVQLTRAQHAGPDVDQDNVPDGLEQLLGSSPVTRDTDVDKIDDATETWGNAGFSPTEYGTAIVKDIYVEIDYMNGAPNPNDNRIPYSALPADVAATFLTDGGVKAWVFIDQALPWYELISTSPTGCVGFGSCIPFDTVYNNNFLLGKPSARWFFHYALWGYKILDPATGTPTCDAGVAEIGGQGSVVSLGCHDLSVYTNEKQRGTFVHEVGHNLTLGHNGNFDRSPSNANSLIHGSVMNYRYQFSGVPRNGNRATYSDGTGSCAACVSSPKAACVSCGCGGPQCNNCDCDIAEWNVAQWAFSDHFTGPPWELGAGPRTASPAKGQLSAFSSSPLPDSTLRQSAARIASGLRSKGWVEGKDFVMAADGLRVLSVCH